MSGEIKPGDRFLDRFQIKYLAAEGGMASIYLASDDISGHDIAVKALYPYYADNSTIRKRFLEEGRIQKVLRHPNILRVFDVIEKPALAILMEYIDGPTLDEFLAERGPLSTEEVIDVIIPVMSAVGFAHSRGIVHRDIKPSNILLQHGNLRSPKILDFGVAKVKDSVQELTATGTTVGTLHYMSPEQIVGSKNIDGRADIYSLGVSMYKLVTGEVPFNAPTEFALMMAQVEAPPLPPSKLRPELSPDLEAVILKAIEKKPGQRYQTIKDFTSALLALRVRPETSVGETLNGVVASEIIDIALQADEVAVDRTSTDGFLVLSEDDIEFESVPMGSETMEIEATLKIKREPATQPTRVPKESTEELSNSAVVRLTKASIQLDPKDYRDETYENADVETVSIPSLTSRMSDAVPMDDNTFDEPKDTSIATRPSRPSNVISEKHLASVLEAAASTGDDEKDTVSMQQQITRASIQVPRLEEPDDQPETVETAPLRSGIHIADSNADSRDMTAPKIPERNFRKILEEADEQAALSQSARFQSGPKEVIGRLPADTSEQTQLRDRGRLQQRIKEMEAERAAQEQRQGSHVAGVSPSSDPLEDGRIHLPVTPRPSEQSPLPKGPGDSQRTQIEFGATRPPVETETNLGPKSNARLTIVFIVAVFVIIIAVIVLAALAVL